MDERIPIKQEYCSSIKNGLEKDGYLSNGMTGLYTPSGTGIISWHFYLPDNLHKKLPVAFMGKDYLQLLHAEERVSGTVTYWDHHARIKETVSRILKEGVI